MEYLELSLHEFIAKQATSQSLRARITEGCGVGNIPFDNILDYIEAGSSAIFEMNSYLGDEKLASELHILINEAYDDNEVCTTGKSNLDISCAKEVKQNNISNLTQHNLSIFELIKHKNISVRLANVCLSESFPFKTVKDYLDEGPSAINRLLKVKNLGRKTAFEFIDLIDKATVETNPRKNKTLIPNDNLSDLLINEFIKNKNISVRLENVCTSGRFPYKKVGDYLNDGPKAINKLLKVENLGRKTVFEFKRLIDEALKEDDSVKIVNINQLVKIFSSVIGEKFFKFLEGRAIDGLTLEEIGRPYGITRERVRQVIEKKIILKYKRLYLDESKIIYSQIIERLKEHGEYIETNNMASWFSCSVKEFLLFIYLHNESANETCKKIINGNNHIFIEPEPETKLAWETKIQKEFFSSSWPISLKDILACTPGIPSFFVTNYLRNKYRIQVKEGLVESAAIPLTQRFIFMFRKVKRPLHISEATRLFNNLFNDNATQHTINATLGRLNETLIVNQGTYNTYENLKFSESNIIEIRNKVHLYLLDKNKFLSSKIIFNNLFKNDPMEWDQEFNYQMLHGIVQDDTRFLTRPGFMVGLKIFKKNSSKSIEEEVIEILTLSNPLTLGEIHNQFLKTRVLSIDSIKKTIVKSQDVIDVDDGKYDLLCNIFTSITIYEEFVLQAQIILLGGPQSPRSIIEKFNNVSSLNLKPCSIISILSSLTDIKLNNGIFQNDTIPDSLRIYDNITKNALKNGDNEESIKATIENIKNTLEIKSDIYLMERYFKIDPRFNLQMNDKSHSTPSKNDELNKILDEFNF
jgi:predicted DNA-binding protein YlxM (UPF0122 family)